MTALRAARASVCLLALTARAPASGIVVIPPPAGGTNDPTADGLSPDGSVVTGDAYVGGTHYAYRYQGGVSVIIPPGPHKFTQRGTGASLGGQRIVGYGVSSGSFSAFLWDAQGGARPIPGTGAVNSYRISADGSTVVGYFQPGTPDWVVARYTEPGGVQVLPGMQGVGGQSVNVSADASTVCGWVRRLGYRQAFVWSSQAGPLYLPYPTSRPDRDSSAEDVTPDGHTVVGFTTTNPHLSEGFRWTPEGGMQLLAFPAGADWAGALSVSADGGTILGTARFTGTNTDTAVLWDSHGVRTVLQAALDAGIPVQGWRFGGPSELSDDGLTIMTSGTDPDGITHGVLIQLPSPAPTSLLLPLLPLLAPRRRRPVPQRARI